MLPKKTMTDISLVLADIQFKKWCDELDGKVQDSLKKAFKDERISQERINRIVERFCANMLKGKIKN